MTVANTTIGIGPPGKSLISPVRPLDCKTNAANASCAATKSVPVKIIVSKI